MSKKQNKSFEITLFDQLANEGNYELSTKSFYRYIFQFLKVNKILIKGKALEAGCGSGKSGKTFLKKFSNLKIVGVDISPQMVKRANDKTKSYKAIVGDLENRNLFGRNTFDFVLCFLVLHHFPSLPQVFKNLDKWVKKDGYLIIVEPNGENLVGKVSHQIRKIIELIFGKEYLLKTKMATPNEHNHTLGLYKSLLLANNFKVIKHAYFFDEPDLPLSFSLGGLRGGLSRGLRFLFPNSRLTQTTTIMLAKHQS